MNNSVSEQIRSFIVENFLFGESDNSLKDTDSFLDSNIIDSTGILELVSFLEETHNIQVEDEELIPENLDSIDAIAMFVHNKRQSG